MNLSEKIKELPFFRTRKVIDVSTEQSGIGLIGFKESEDDIYSNLILSPKSESGVIPDIAMVSSRGCLVRLDDGDKTIVISMSSEGDKEGFVETLPATIDDGEFFQSSLINDYRHITYEYIEVLVSAIKILNDSRTENK